MHTRPGGADDPSDRAGPERSGLGSRRVVWISFAASAAIHVLAVVLYPLMFERIDPSGGFLPPPTTDGRPQGSVVVRLLEIDETPDTQEPDEPAEIEELEEPEEEAEDPTPDVIPGIELVRPGPTAAERLRANLGDPRLWRTPPPEFFELTLEQREELILADRIGSWLDSVQAAQAAKDALTDWTFTDADGGRWGVSPGKIHLGDVTLPLPVSFGIPVGKRDETSQLVWQWEEVMRQAARADVALSWKERAAAIRARRDAERVSERPDTTRRR